MLRSHGAARTFLLLSLLGAVALCLIAGAQTAQTTRRTTTRGAQSKPSPTPIVVPRRPQATATPRATPTPARVVVVPSQNDAPPPPPIQTPTPKPTPTPEEPEDESEVVRVTSNLVVVPVAVTDAAGNAVQGLKKEDFRLEEEGRAQELATVGTADEVPLDIAILFDISSSISGKNLFEFEQESAASFLKQVLKPGDRAAVFSIAEKARLEQGLVSADDAATKIRTLPAATVPTGTAFYDTVTAAAKYLATNAPAGHRRVILVISDGDDNFSEGFKNAKIAEVKAGGDLVSARERSQTLHRRAIQQVQKQVQDADTVFYSVNPGGQSVRLNVISQRAQEGMQEIAESTGGAAFLPNGRGELEGVLRQIAAELRAQYLLQYLSNNQATAGKFLRIKVTTPARPELHIRARQGYYKKG